MDITVIIDNKFQSHEVRINTDGLDKLLTIPAKSTGFGSFYSGGEILFLAIATCVCNDLYREAGKRNIRLTSVIVTVKGEFTGEGEPASVINYSVEAHSEEDSNTVNELINYVDQIAEIHNTIRNGTPILLQKTLK